MAYLVFSALLLGASYLLIGSTTALYVLAVCQLTLLGAEIRRRQVSGVGGFIFMSFLFFAIRPIYLVLENDYNLFHNLFLIRVDITEVGASMWWGSAALLFFALGARLAPQVNRKWLARRRARARNSATDAVVGVKICYALMFLQLMTLPVMLVLSRMGRSLYSSGLGAYAYDFPVPLQAVHILTVVVLCERFLRRKSVGTMTMMTVSVVLFLFFTWLMRDVSAFRGFYVAGLMIAGIALLQRLKGRVGYVWLILPVVLLQPLFQYLGQSRGVQNEQLAEVSVVDEVFQNRTLGQTYWEFYKSNGDMNIFDTFVAAKKAEPAFYPYLWSWAYVPLHWVPRKLWPGKPKAGITIDSTYARGAPYAPGIAGFFLLDGGLIWMLGSMAVLGFLMATLDAWVFTLPRGYLQYCMIGIVTINGMFLTRFFLWQYFYQMLYAIIPIVGLAWWFGRSAKMSAASSRNQRRSIRGVVATD